MTGIPARLAAASGAFSALAVLIGAALFDAEASSIARTGYLLVVLGSVAFVVFAAYLYRILRLAEGREGWGAMVALSAGLLFSAVRFTAQLPRMIESYRGDTLSPEIARLLEDLNDMAFVVSGLLLGLFVAAAGEICSHRRVVARRLGWFGLASGGLAVVAGVIGMVDPDSYSPLPYLGGLAWVLVVSLVLTVRMRGPVAEPVRSEPAPRRTGVTGAA